MTPENGRIIVGDAEMASARVAGAARQGDMFIASAAPAAVQDQPLPLLCE